MFDCGPARRQFKSALSRSTLASPQWSKNHGMSMQLCLCDWAFKRSHATYRKGRASCPSGRFPRFIHQVIITGLNRFLPEGVKPPLKLQLFYWYLGKGISYEFVSVNLLDLFTFSSLYKPYFFEVLHGSGTQYLYERSLVSLYQTQCMCLQFCKLFSCQSATDHIQLHLLTYTQGKWLPHWPGSVLLRYTRGILMNVHINTAYLRLQGTRKPLHVERPTIYVVYFLLR